MRFAANLVLPLALVLGGGVGCSRSAKTPAEALNRLGTAVENRDEELLYAALDRESRWSWMSVRRAHREAYDIVLSNFPEGAAREQQLKRFENGALAENDAALFAKAFPEQRWDEFGKTLPAGSAVETVSEEHAQVRLGERILPFRRSDDGSWGFAGFAAEAEEEKRKATADLELVRTNAADLERAATRAGR